MAVNNTPTAILETRGSFIANPSRRRPAEPTTNEPLGSAPRYLTADEKKLWKELAKQVLPGVAKVSDRSMFELTVRLVLQMRTAYATMTAAERTCLVSALSHFGMSPSSRTRIVVEAPPKSKLAAFLTKPA